MFFKRRSPNSSGGGRPYQKKQQKKPKQYTSSMSAAELHNYFQPGQKALLRIFISSDNETAKEIKNILKEKIREAGANDFNSFKSKFSTIESSLLESRPEKWKSEYVNVHTETDRIFFTKRVLLLFFLKELELKEDIFKSFMKKT